MTFLFLTWQPLTVVSALGRKLQWRDKNLMSHNASSFFQPMFNKFETDAWAHCAESPPSHFQFPSIDFRSNYRLRSASSLCPPFVQWIISLSPPQNAGKKASCGRTTSWIFSEIVFLPVYFMESISVWPWLGGIESLSIAILRQMPSTKWTTRKVAFSSLRQRLQMEVTLFFFACHVACQFVHWVLDALCGVCHSPSLLLKWDEMNLTDIFYQDLGGLLPERPTR